jgi:hypothetical protein
MNPADRHSVVWKEHSGGGGTVTQCEGTTKKGDRCKREARTGSSYCAIHQDQEIRARTPRVEQEWDSDALMKAAIGVGLIAAIFLFRFRR